MPTLHQYGDLQYFTVSITELGCFLTNYRVNEQVIKHSKEIISTAARGDLSAAIQCESIVI